MVKERSGSGLEEEDSNEHRGMINQILKCLDVPYGGRKDFSSQWRDYKVFLIAFAHHMIESEEKSKKATKFYKKAIRRCECPILAMNMLLSIYMKEAIRRKNSSLGMISGSEYIQKKVNCLRDKYGFYLGHNE
jgi:hypothetical protein